GTPLAALVAHRGGVQACGVSSDGTRIVSASHDGTVKVWDVSLALGGALVVPPAGRASSPSESQLTVDPNLTDGLEARPTGGTRNAAADASEIGPRFSPDGSRML